MSPQPSSYADGNGSVSDLGIPTFGDFLADDSGKVADLLIDCIPEDREWGDDGDITVQIPEHVAWEIREVAEKEDYAWACFAPPTSL
jgi:hypothetical protein